MMQKADCADACNSRDLASTEQAALLDPAILRLWRAFPSLAPEVRRAALTSGDIQKSPQEGYMTPGNLVVVMSGCLAVQALETELCAELLNAKDIYVAGRAARFRWVVPGEMFTVPISTWLDKSGPSGADFLQEGLVARAERIERQFVCAVSHQGANRLADALMVLHHAAPTAPIRLSQRVLGDMLGLQRTTVNSVMAHLVEKGTLRVGRMRLTVVDPSSLQQEACGCRSRRS